MPRASTRSSTSTPSLSYGLDSRHASKRLISSGARLIDRQLEMKHRSMQITRRDENLTAMGRDNGSADRKSHARSVLFRREKRLEYAAGDVLVDTCSSILYRQRHPGGSDLFGSQLQYPCTVPQACHGIDTVHHQIQHDLL